MICIADIARHGRKLHEAGADLLVDRFDTARAVDIIKGVAGGNLRFGIDIVGKDTATILQEVLSAYDSDTSHAHLLGLTGLPKERDPGVRYHAVPIKAFHTVPAVGESLVLWLEGLLEKKALILPDIIVRRQGGLSDVNAALDFLRSGAASGKRIVIDMMNSTVSGV